MINENVKMNFLNIFSELEILVMTLLNSLIILSSSTIIAKVFFINKNIKKSIES